MQASSIHLVVVPTKVWLVHRHLVSVTTQSPSLALIMHGRAQAVRWEGCQRENAMIKGRVELTWKGILASEEGRGGCRNSDATKGEACNGVEAHYMCVKWGKKRYSVSSPSCPYVLNVGDGISGDCASAMRNAAPFP